MSWPYTLPSSGPGTAIPATPANVMRFHSRHDLEPPAVTVTTAATNPALGDIFLAPDTGPGQAGPRSSPPAASSSGSIHFRRGRGPSTSRLKRYRGASVLTWWQGQVVEGHGQGVDVIESDRYMPIATVHAGNGLYADLHDFEITSQGTAWLVAYAPQHWDLTPYGGPRDGLIDDSVVQEIDIKTGLVMYEWHAIGHVAISDTYKRIPQMTTTVLDYFHLNSIDPLPNGELLISSRNTWATYLINQATGRLVWRLGGKKSSFRLGPGVSFAWQHDALMRPDGTISLFDNEAGPAEASESRVLDIASTPAPTARRSSTSSPTPARASSPRARAARSGSRTATTSLAGDRPARSPSSHQPDSSPSTCTSRRPAVPTRHPAWPGTPSR